VVLFVVELFLGFHIGIFMGRVRMLDFPVFFPFSLLKFFGRETITLKRNNNTYFYRHLSEKSNSKLF